MVYGFNAKRLSPWGILSAKKLSPWGNLSAKKHSPWGNLNAKKLSPWGNLNAKKLSPWGHLSVKRLSRNSDPGYIVRLTLEGLRNISSCMKSYLSPFFRVEVLKNILLNMKSYLSPEGSMREQNPYGVHLSILCFIPRREYARAEPVRGPFEYLMI